MENSEDSGMRMARRKGSNSPTSQLANPNSRPRESPMPRANPKTGMCLPLIGDTGVVIQLSLAQLIPHVKVKDLGWDLTDREHLPVGGRIRMFLRNWQLVTRDLSILEAVRGYHIEFVRDPPVSKQILEALRFSPDRTLLVDQEVQSLLAKQAIVETHPNKIKFWSQIFLREKKGSVAAQEIMGRTGYIAIAARNRFV